jgi:lauroyl/myristoyl acyltransferase
VRAHPEQWMMFHPFWPERGNRNEKLEIRN